MYKINCLNPIAQVGLENFNEQYEITKDVKEADGILVRSASMHEMEIPEKLLAVARAGAGSTISLWTNVQSREWWYLILPVPMPMV